MAKFATPGHTGWGLIRRAIKGTTLKVKFIGVTLVWFPSTEKLFRSKNELKERSNQCDQIDRFLKIFKVSSKSSPNISQQYCEKWNFYINLMWILFGQLLSTIGLLFTPTSCQLVRTEQKIESEKERNFKCFNLHNFIYLTCTFSCFVWPCLVHNLKTPILKFVPWMN